MDHRVHDGNLSTFHCAMYFLGIIGTITVYKL